MKILYFFCFILSACNYSDANKTAASTEKNLLSPTYKSSHKSLVDSNAKVTYKIINSTGNTFGYEIFIDEKRFIHQNVVPATSGNKGFMNKKDAQKVAELVSRKIIRGEMPPTLSIEEIEHLNLTTKLISEKP